MLIPIRCVTCGTCIASKYKKYKKLLAKVNKTTKESKILTYHLPNTDVYHVPMEQVGLKRPCCKRHFLGQQEMIYRLTQGY